ncbi:MAG: Nuclear actin-protein involved in chromatin remodeling [Phylliscum demangeonii]|nr:MAG: Nuclear actin-protein involved in chromatin remodeling [Phylliscum demangeonii]
MTQPPSGQAKGAPPDSELPPPRIWDVREPVAPKAPSSIPGGYQDSSRHGSDQTAIVIDNGSSSIRAGWSFDKAPRLTFPPIVSRYRDRKLSKTYTFVGQDAYVDANARGQIRTAFEAGSGVVSNWDVMETALDYVFLQLGVTGDDGGGVSRAIVMTEPVANLGYSRKTMTEILFECYSAPSVAYGIDSLFSYYYNGGQTGLVISSSHSSTHLIPVVDRKPMRHLATRLNWGGQQNADFLLKLLQLKYPNFPGKLTSAQAEALVREHCYVSLDYEEELSRYLDWTGLEERDHTIQFPFTEQVVVQKTAEELARAAEKRKQSGVRLQEQAAKARLDKLIKQEQELEYYKELRQRASSATKKELRRMLESNDLDSEAQLEKVMRELEKAIQKKRAKDLGGEGGNGADEGAGEGTEPAFPLLEIADDELDEAQLKQKRQQRLAKANVDARARAKAEKEREKARVEEERRRDEERRETDLDGWVEDRRRARQKLLQKIKERQRLKADLGNRKSLASQLRMKSIATLASDSPGAKKRRRAGGGGGAEYDDGFGANDDDWGVYRTITMNDDGGGGSGGGAVGGAGGGGGGGSDNDADEADELTHHVRTIEAELLQYDAAFTEQETLAAQTDWSKSLLHAFTRGARPFDAESGREVHQLHLNVERIRVPEVVFQPSAIAGLDQAGLVEIAATILTQRLPPAADATGVLADVFLTGGNVLFRGFDGRLRRDLTAVLPAAAPLRVRRAADPLRDAWAGAAQWAAAALHSPASASSAAAVTPWAEVALTRAAYDEMGADYLKEHDLGNMNLGSL